VRGRRCGADAWRRTGVVTFDGNRKHRPKASYKCIQEHLKQKYQTKKIKEALNHKEQKEAIG